MTRAAAEALLGKGVSSKLLKLLGGAAADLMGMSSNVLDDGAGAAGLGGTSSTGGPEVMLVVLRLSWRAARTSS